MSRLCKLILALACGLANGADATVWLDDTWADGTRTNQNLPTDSAWFCSTAASLTATTNAMYLAVGSGSVMALSYFTANTNISIQLTPGDTLIATFRLTFTSIAAANSSQGFKL